MFQLHAKAYDMRHISRQFVSLLYSAVTWVCDEVTFSLFVASCMSFKVW